MDACAAGYLIVVLVFYATPSQCIVEKCCRCEGDTYVVGRLDHPEHMESEGSWRGSPSDRCFAGRPYRVAVQRTDQELVHLLGHIQWEEAVDAHLLGNLELDLVVKDQQIGHRLGSLGLGRGRVPRRLCVGSPLPSYVPSIPCGFP